MRATNGNSQPGTGSIMERALPNRTFQKHNGRGVYVPNGMSVVELVEVAQELEREFEIDGTTAKLMAESALNVINRLRAEN